jgi:hypothetical protein
MTDPTHIKASSTRVGGPAVKDDKGPLDDVIAAVHDQMMSLDPARAERVIILIIRRHRDAKCVFRAMINANRRRRRPTTVTFSP